MVRVIAGSARGRKLVAPRSALVRPTSDRVRESIFDILESRDAIEGARVLDLFAGSGALGIEALSRGAAAVCLVDHDRVAIEAVRANLVRVGLDTRGPGEPEVDVVCSDAVSFCSRCREPFDLALCDPPYAFDRWPRLLEVLPARLGVLESSVPVEPTGGFTLARTYRYGTTIVSIVTSHASPERPDVR